LELNSDHQLFLKLSSVVLVLMCH